jgi:RNA polymerase sigma-54 factor
MSRQTGSCEIETMAFLENRLVLKTAQKTVLTPGLVQMVNLLALNKLELVDMISEELVENPVLEEATEVLEEQVPEEKREKPEAADEGDEHYERLKERQENAEPTVENPEPEPPDEDQFRDFDLQEFENYLNDGSARPRETEVFERPSFETFLSRPSTLVDHLEWQLGLVPIDDSVRAACDSIIGNLNDDGYLAAVDEKGREIPIDLEEIARFGDHDLQVVERALLVTQAFDPPGVAARDIRECLLIQLSLLVEDNLIAMQIVTDYLRKVQNQQFREIAKAFKRPLDEILVAVNLIKTLDPRPGQKYNKPEARHIEPDVFLVKVGDEYKVVANEDEVPHLRLSQTYRKMLDKGAVDKEVRNYVKDRFKSAVQLLKNIEQRKNIIVKVCEAIVRHQSGFLDNGIDWLRPMMIKDVAEEVGVHPSTVSRAVANKFSHTPQGVFELRFFFSEAVNGINGVTTSLTLVKLKVKRLILAEDPRKPLTDEKIAQLLKEDGISVTRRSITKYREDLKIPSTHQRRLRV